MQSYCSNAYCFDHPCLLHPLLSGANSNTNNDINNNNSNNNTNVDTNYKVAIVCTLKLPEFGVCTLHSFLSYHLHKGFCPILLFFDNPQDKAIPMVEEKFPPEKVIIFKNDDNMKKMWEGCKSFPALTDFVSSEVQARQHLNAEVAMQWCVSKGVQWLLHIDSDELFFTREHSVIPHFQELEAAGVEQMTYTNHEGVPERADVIDYFKEVTLFRRHHLSLPLSEASRIGMEFWQNRTTHEQYLLCYDNGKSATRVRETTVPASVHAWKLLPQYAECSRTSLVDPRKLEWSKVRTCEDPCILHYVVCGLPWLRSKYEMLGRFPDAWFGGRLPIAPSFHLNARDAVLSSSSLPVAAAVTSVDHAKQFFETQILLDDAKEVDRQLEAKVCMRVMDVCQYLESLDPPNTTLSPSIILAKQTLPSSVNSVSQASSVKKDTGAYTSSKAWMLANIAKDFL